MSIRGERTWCAECTAPRVPRREAPLIELFLALLPAWRVSGGLVPVLMEGFDRAEAAAQIDLTPLPCSRTHAWGALLEMESVYRQIRSEQAKTKNVTPGNPDTPVGRAGAHDLAVTLP
jgi:hypothetical protein